MNERIIESTRLKIKLLNGSTITIRPLTLAERKECLALVPKKFSEKDFLKEYMNTQIDVLHYIIARENKNFKKEDVETQLDASLIEQLIQFTLKDPFNENIGMGM